MKIKNYKKALKSITKIVKEETLPSIKKIGDIIVKSIDQ